MAIDPLDGRPIPEGGKEERAAGEQDVEAMFKDFIPLQLQCLADYADLIPGTLEAVADFRRRGLKVGSTTGYTEEMMDLLQSEARKRGYEPDATVCATQVPAVSVKAAPSSKTPSALPLSRSTPAASRRPAISLAAIAVGSLVLCMVVRPFSFPAGVGGCGRARR